MTEPFFQHFVQNFAVLQKQYDFCVASELFEEDGFGSGLLRLASERYFLDFQVDNLGPEVTMHVGRTGQMATDLAWIFAYLTRGLRPSHSGAHSWLYYFPHFTLNRWGEQSISWQAARLADILQPMWPAIFIFLDMDGPRSVDFAAFQERAKRTAAERSADGYRVPPERVTDRNGLGFASQAQKSFAFLSAYGFKLAHADPIFVRYESEARSLPETGAPPPTENLQVIIGQPWDGKPGLPALYVNVFHGFSSYQLGVHTGPVQTDKAFELDFDLAELADWRGADYTPLAANRLDALPAALNRMARLFRRCATPMLAGDMRLFEALHTRRVDAARRVSRAWAERDRGR